MASDWAFSAALGAIVRYVSCTNHELSYDYDKMNACTRTIG